MTKNEWVSYIKNHLLKIDETNKYHSVLIEKTIDTVYGQMFSEEYVKNKRGAWKYVKDYSETMTASTVFSTGHTLTNQPITLPRINGGLFKFTYTTGGAAVECELTGREMYDAINDSTYDTADAPGKMFVALSGADVFINVTLVKDDTITYSIIPKFSTLSDTDEVVVPFGAEEVLGDRVLDTMRMIPPVDLMNDNADRYGPTQ